MTASDGGGRPDSAALRSDLAALLRHHHAAARHQQDVRDRYFRLFFAAAVAAQIAATGLLVWQPVGRTARAAAALFASTGVLGLAFLALSMFQAVNYHLIYRSIAQIHECLAAVHAAALAAFGQPNPFF